MNKYGKLENGTITYATKRIEHNGYITINPTDEQLKGAGYMEVVYTTPEEKEGYIAKSTWKKVRGKIKQTWEYEPITGTDIV